jgi:hypothetical protein
MFLILIVKEEWPESRADIMTARCGCPRLDQVIGLQAIGSGQKDRSSDLGHEAFFGRGKTDLSKQAISKACSQWKVVLRHTERNSLTVCSTWGFPTGHDG